MDISCNNSGLIHAFTEYITNDSDIVDKMSVISQKHKNNFINLPKFYKIVKLMTFTIIYV